METFCSTREICMTRMQCFLGSWTRTRWKSQASSRRWARGCWTGKRLRWRKDVDILSGSWMKNAMSLSSFMKMKTSNHSPEYSRVLRLWTMSSTRRILNLSRSRMRRLKLNLLSTNFPHLFTLRTKFPSNMTVRKTYWRYILLTSFLR